MAETLIPKAPPLPRGDSTDSRSTARTRRVPTWLLGVAPLFLVGVLVFALLRAGPIGVFIAAFPPIEELTIDRITFPSPDEMRIRVVNGGPEPVTVAQVLVDDAVWWHTVAGDRTIDRLTSRDIVVPYPWVDGEPVAVKLVTSTGLTFEEVVDVATLTPRPDARYIGTFTLLGAYVGVIPVFLGLLWFPFIRSIPSAWVDFFLALTAGLLVFLGVDALVEATELAARVPASYQGTGLVLLGLLGTPLLLEALSRLSRRAGRESAVSVALLIAVAIGLHNLGEGLAIGAAYASGAIALGTTLVLGFLLHNTTEGLAIVSPLARERPGIGTLALLGAVAGVPTIVGAWVGGFTYSPLWTTLFLAIGAGAVAQVVYVIGKRFSGEGAALRFSPLNAAGFLVGLLAMYVTGLFVAA
ncbi:MAG: ZIP family metal transporter [Longimicrobiales bacterium]